MKTKTAEKCILVVGAGITGLTAAALLERRGIVVDLVERMPDWNQRGYGITIMPAGLRVLDELGVLSAVKRAGSSAHALNALSPDGSLIRRVRLGAGVETLTLARDDLHRILRSALRKTTIAMDTQVSQLSEKSGVVTVHFTHQKPKRYDLVIGADGIHSDVRNIIFPEAKPVYSGAAVWTFFLPPDIKLPSSTDITQVWNDHEFVGIFPFKHTAAVTLSARFDSKKDVYDADIARLFGDVAFLRDVLPRIKKTQIYGGYLNEIKLRRWYKGSVLLAGDAAHAMMPATGMGSSMGMADAKVIADLVTEGSGNWVDIPVKYQKRRKPQVDRVQTSASLVTKTMFMPAPFKQLRNRAARIVPQFVIARVLND